MISTPRRKHHEWKKKGLFDEKRFYDLLSVKCNYIDQENVKMFYLGLVRLVSEELRENGMVRLPHIGDFAIAMNNRRGGKVLAGRKPNSRMPMWQVRKGPTRVLKFYPNDAWRKYFFAKDIIG